MFRFTIRDVLWLMVVVGLAVSWWIDNKRIETMVGKLASERRLMEADFKDRMTMLDEMQKSRRGEVADAVRNRLPIPPRQ